MTITGTNFTGATAVNFGATAATDVHRQQRHLDHGDLAGARAGTVDVTVTTPGGTSADVGAATSSPTSRRRRSRDVSPNSRPDRGRHLGHHHRHQLHRRDRGQLRRHRGHRRSPSTTPPRSRRRRRPTAAARSTSRSPRAGGTSATGANDQFTYCGGADGDAIVSPTTGPTAGGTSVTITGTNFTGATAVNFGATAATDVHRQQRHHRSPRPRRRTQPARSTSPSRPPAAPARPAPRPVHLRRGADGHERQSPTTGTTRRRHLGDHHRHRLHRRDRGQLRRHRSHRRSPSTTPQPITATSPAHAAGTVDVTVTTRGRHQRHRRQ